MAEAIVLEIFIEDEWHEFAQIEINPSRRAEGYRAPASFEYAFDYLDRFGQLLGSRGLYSASLRYPLTYEFIKEKHWPAFLLDLIPTGAARKNWINRLQIKDGIGADAPLLEQAAINPPGNIRVQTSEDVLAPLKDHPGFSYEEIIERGIDFIEYAELLGAIVSGTSGAQGESPKFLLVQDHKGRWHGDGAIPNDQIQKSWLIKFPRGKTTRDYQILKAEAQYYEVARDLGIRTLGPLQWQQDTLFIPRFDREWGNRWGLESLISAMGISEFGATLKHENAIKTIQSFCSEPEMEIKEYILRDFTNIVMGNTDNHGRNTAFIKKSATDISLSPLFDFAPMALDDAGIARVSKWQKETYHIPDFAGVVSSMTKAGIATESAIDFLKECRDRLSNIPDLLSRHGLDQEVRVLATKKYDDFMKALAAFLERA